jgi:hypothetical protein
MRLKSVCLKGYCGIPSDLGLELMDFGHRNVFIGPNNSGKSTVFRFLHHLRTKIDSLQANLVPIEDEIDESWWWQHEATAGISAAIVLSDDDLFPKIDPSLEGKFVVDGEWQVEVLLKPCEGGKCRLIVAPRVYLAGHWQPIIRQGSEGSDKPMHLNKNGEYIYSSGRDSCPYHEPALELLKAWAGSVRFFDPIRAVDRSRGSRGMDDGAGLLAYLLQRQLDPRQTAVHARFTKNLIVRINSLMEPGGVGGFDGCELKGSEEKPQMYLSQKNFGGPPIALESMGTGIAELVILVSALVEDTGKSIHYFIEEPEIHLHPGLLRRFMSFLSGFPDAQFFVSSHSNVVLDALGSCDRVFRFHQRSDGSCISTPCKGIVEQHRVLDSLGVSGSTLLQTNCVVWVEGPSDRLYVRHWLEQAGSTLQEGSDYSCVFYGGKILSHFGFEESDSDADDLLLMIRICRYSAVIMDRDLAPGESALDLREAKRKIVEQAKSDVDHRLALITEGREIENDLPIDILCRASGKILGRDEHDLAGLALPGHHRYPVEVVEHLGLSGDSAETAKRKLSNKIVLARQVLEICEDEGLELQPPAYLERLREFIASSRVLES